MESMSYLFGILSVCLLAYIMSVMVTKKDLRKFLGDQQSRTNEMRSLLEARKGTACTLVLAEASTAAGGTKLVGTLVDVDDEWVLVEAEQKKGGTRSVALRLDRVQGLEE